MNSEKQRHFKKTDLIFAAVILLLAGGVWLWQRAGAKSGNVAVLQYGDSGTTMEISLDADGETTVDTGTYTIHLEVKAGAIRFVDSPCPDHRCEAFGWLSEDGDWAACLPAQALVTVEQR